MFHIEVHLLPLHFNITYNIRYLTAFTPVVFTFIRILFQSDIFTFSQVWDWAQMHISRLCSRWWWRGFSIFCRDSTSVNLRAANTTHSASLPYLALFSDLIHVYIFTGDEATIYKSVPVQEPQHRNDFLRCECWSLPVFLLWHTSLLSLLISVHKVK